MPLRKKNGQAILLMVVGMGVLLIGAAGLLIDGAQLYAHRQLAQVAADAAAQAGAVSILQGVYNAAGTNAHAFDPTSAAGFTCIVGDQKLPCMYAALNGFGTSASDTVKITFPAGAGSPFAAICNPPAVTTNCVAANQVKAAVSRQVSTSLMRLISSTQSLTITATGTAAIVSITSPVPLLILHPHNQAALSMNGSSTIKICSGPSQSIQVNSDNATTYTLGTIDLSQAGPNNTGADFGTFGPPTQAGASIQTGAVAGGACPSTTSVSAKGSISLGTTGHYTQPSSPIPDPLLGVQPPVKPPDAKLPTGVTGAGVPCFQGSPGCSPFTNLHGCNAVDDPNGCWLYTQGNYPGGIVSGNVTAIFTPGVYYMDQSNGFSSNGNMKMCSDCGNDSLGVTADGMLVYNSGGGTFNVGSNGNINLVGTPETSVYKGILFFQDRGSPAATGDGSHILGGNNFCLQLVGTIYATNTVPTILASAGLDYQEIRYHGVPCSSTVVRGMIVTDALTMDGPGFPTLAMLLEPQGYLKLMKIALIQ